ncbi:hypothetical protein ABZ502_17215 [Streptomyces abikoensis]|uniref:hypothetical protein n=1 Tax=Streptomyces abikoensis TaxID=97398 RepID=UPI0033DF8894
MNTLPEVTVRDLRSLLGAQAEEPVLYLDVETMEFEVGPGAYVPHQRVVLSLTDLADAMQVPTEQARETWDTEYDTADREFVLEALDLEESIAAIAAEELKGQADDSDDADEVSRA